MKFRDLLAVPFWALALKLNDLALSIGGKWTVQMFLEQEKAVCKLFNDEALEGRK